MPDYPTNPALEAAVIANAEDDTPRLVYADWLDENGDPDRAAFIRTQIALWDKHPADEDYIELVEAEIELRAKMRGRFLTLALPPGIGLPLDHPSVYHENSVGIQRGFPYFVAEPSLNDRGADEQDARRFRDALPALFHSTTARGLDLQEDFRRSLRVILGSPSVTNVSALLTTQYDYERDEVGSAVEHLAASECVPHLSWLELDTLWQPADLDTLANLPFKRLRRFATTILDDPGRRVDRLLGSPGFRGVHRMAIALNNAAAEAIPRLAALRELHTLELGADGASLEKLARPKNFPSLGRLDIRAAGPLADAVITLTRANLPRLAALQFLDGELSGADVAEITEADWFEGLTVFGAERNPVGNDGVKALAASRAADSLRVVRLGQAQLGRGALELLGRGKSFPRVTTLDVGYASARTTPASDLAQTLRSFTNNSLRHLDLSGWPIGDEGAIALAKTAVFGHLSVLKLASCSIGKGGLKALAESPHLKHLVRLSLDSNPCEKSVEILRAPDVFPKLAECGITFPSAKVRDKLLEARPKVWGSR